MLDGATCLPGETSSPCAPITSRFPELARSPGARWVGINGELGADLTFRFGVLERSDLVDDGVVAAKVALLGGETCDEGEVMPVGDTCSSKRARIR